MEPRISIITLGVADLERSYRRAGCYGVLREGSLSGFLATKRMSYPTDTIT
jgi:hypothetical protein